MAEHKTLSPKKMKKGKKREGKQEEERGKAETGHQTEGPGNLHSVHHFKRKKPELLYCFPRVPEHTSTNWMGKPTETFFCQF